MTELTDTELAHVLAMRGELLTVSEAAAELGVHIATIRRWSATDRLKSLRTSGGHRRFKREDVLKLKGPKQ